MKLYEIPVEYRRLLDSVDESGEITPEIEAGLNALETSLEIKADAIASLIKEADAEARAFATEAERLTDRRRAAENRADHLKQYLLSAMDSLDIAKLKTPRFSLGIQKASRPSIRWTGSVDKAPAAFVRTITSIDGTAAYEAYKAKALPEGFEVSTSYFLAIR